MNLLLIAGHGAGDPGAVWNGRREADETRRLAADIQRAIGSRCTVARYPENRNAYSDYQAGSLNQTAQFSQYDAVLELHFNAAAAGTADGKLKGVEAYVTTTETDTALASALCGALASLGFPNRGVKRKNWAVIAAARRQGFRRCCWRSAFWTTAMIWPCMTAAITRWRRRWPPPPRKRWDGKGRSP